MTSLFLKNLFFPRLFSGKTIFFFILFVKKRRRWQAYIFILLTELERFKGIWKILRFCDSNGENNTKKHFFFYVNLTEMHIFFLRRSFMSIWSVFFSFRKHGVTFLWCVREDWPSSDIFYCRMDFDLFPSCCFCRKTKALTNGAPITLIFHLFFIFLLNSVSV